MRPGSGQQFQADWDQIRHVHWVRIGTVMFTGSGLELSCLLGQDWNCHVHWVSISFTQPLQFCEATQLLALPATLNGLQYF